MQMSSHFIAELKFAVQLSSDISRELLKRLMLSKKRLVELHLKEGKVAKTS